MVPASRVMRLNLLSFPPQKYAPALNSTRVRRFTTTPQLNKNAEKPTEEGPEVETEKGERTAEQGDQNQAVENRDLYLSVLSSTSTKREAQAYLQRFKPSLAASPSNPGQPDAPPLVPPLKFMRQSPLTPSDTKARNQTYVQRLLENNPPIETSQSPVSPDLFTPKISEEDIHVGLIKIREVSGIDDVTLRGIGRTICLLRRLGLFSVVVVDEPQPARASPLAIATWRSMAEKQADRIVCAVEQERGQARRVDGSLSVGGEDSILKIALNHVITPLSRGVIPVLCPVAYSATQHIAPTTANEVILRLTMLLSIHTPKQSPVEQPISLDRIIFLDPLGGIPSVERPSGSHVFINLEQEYTTLEAQLSTIPNNYHHANLSTLRRVLSMLPPTSSGVITTPSLAATHNVISMPSSSNPPKRSKNPLIHNLLTDKPLISSSLPVRSISQTTLTTLLKHGIPIIVHPPGTRLTDASRINLQKLTTLIEDSFGKRLDVQHYLSRVNDHIAAVIIAGDYEGGAIVTWEYPDGDETRKRVCYLDKFAVLRKSQGQGGVADVVFKKMVESVTNGLFEGVEGIVWRSRRWNPVNKWYFERAKGTWKVPSSGWTMFWTTQDAEVGTRRFQEYAEICARIEPSLFDE